jgi:aminoglycoside phosphotransferase (APT) family kinase protein
VGAEAGWLALARAGGVPVPRVLEVDASGVRCGAPVLVTEFVGGEVLLPAGVDRERGEAVGRELIHRLVQIQAVELGSPALRRAGSTFAPALLTRWGGVLEAERARRPILVGELVARWLADHLPEPSQPVLVHGDYRLGNLIWSGDEVVAVLDWEGAAAGDPLYDLAWLLMGTRSASDLVMNAWPREQVLKHYGALSGGPVDPDRLGWWEVAVAWVRMAMEIKLLRLSAAASPPDLRGLIWEFGHGSAARAMLERIDPEVVRG